MVTTLPSDFDIFSPPSFSKPECIQWRAKLLVAERALGLRDLVLVVREDQVVAAAVDVERLAEIAVRHRRALDVPARAARAPRARPTTARPAWRAFHSAKSSGLVLLLVDLDARARLQIVELCARELAVRGKLADRVVDVAADGVGEAVRDQPLDDVDDLGDVLGRARLDVGRAQAERVQVDVHTRRCSARATSSAVFALVVALVDDLVVDVGDVADEAQREAAGAQVAPMTSQATSCARGRCGEVVDRVPQT